MFALGRAIIAKGSASVHTRMQAQFSMTPSVSKKNNVAQGRRKELKLEGTIFGQEFGAGE